MNGMESAVRKDEDFVAATLFEDKTHNRTYRVEMRMGNKVLTLNGKPLARTVNKSDEFYNAYIEGFERAALIVEHGDASAFNIKKY